MVLGLKCSKTPLLKNDPKETLLEEGDNLIVITKT